ncbi:MAG: YkgJ family cysteine cluster protein [Planctomycetota bacterium]|nr:YkgJ family cysteine cluster protein [Planctomycetota bacterium]
MTLALPILIASPLGQKYSCHSCGNCCRDFTVQLRDEDMERLREQKWESELGEPVTIRFRGKDFLRQRPDGSCIFLQSDGLCKVHSRFGLQAKPVACRFFPFSVMPAGTTSRAGLNFACQSVQDNKGAHPFSHLADLQRMVDDAPESTAQGKSVALSHRLAAEGNEVESLRTALIEWLARGPMSVSTRVGVVALIAQQLFEAKLAQVRGDRFQELVQILMTAACQWSSDRPIEPTSSSERGLLRQAIFMRVSDPRLSELRSRGWFRTTSTQLIDSFRFQKGFGNVPTIRGIESSVSFKAVERIEPLRASMDAEAIDDLFSRWLGARIAGERAWGSGYYGTSAIEGLCALSVDAAAAGWIARLHCAGAGRNIPTMEDAKFGVGRIDRSAGRAPWLWSQGESLRLRFFTMRGALARLCAESI